jgi:hypothetical protein
MNPANKTLLKKAAWAYPAIVFGAIAPVLLAMSAGWIASLFGAELNEGSPPNIGGIAGPLISQALYFLGVCGWLILFTVPIGVCLFISYTIYVVVGLFRNRRATTPPQ